ncbi:hypothetical protein ACS3QZ_08760 [Shimia sp. W99]
MTTRLASVVLLIAALVSAPALQAQDINVEKKRSRLQQLLDAPLKGDARREFKQFRRKGQFYGAFFANLSENVAGSYWDAANLETAETHARTSCESKSVDPQGCILYARVLPKKYDPTESGLTLSRSGNQDFREYIRLQDVERYGAFAMSDNGAIGYSWAEHSRASADREALKRCTKSARKLLRNTPKHLQGVLASSPQHVCRVVHRSG